MKNKRGFSELVLILIVVLVLAFVAFLVLKYNKNAGMPTSDQENSLLFSPAPVSDSTDTTTLQQELDATIPGTVDSDLDSMFDAASAL